MESLPPLAESFCASSEASSSSSSRTPRRRKQDIFDAAARYSFTFWLVVTPNSFFGASPFSRQDPAQLYFSYKQQTSSTIFAFRMISVLAVTFGRDSASSPLISLQLAEPIRPPRPISCSAILHTGPDFFLEDREYPVRNSCLTARGESAFFRGRVVEFLDPFTPPLKHYSEQGHSPGYDILPPHSLLPVLSSFYGFFPLRPQPSRKFSFLHPVPSR